MKEEIKQTDNNTVINIKSIDLLDNNYIHLIGKRGYEEINVITNNQDTLDFKGYKKAKSIFSFNNHDYIITVKENGYDYLIDITNKEILIKRQENIRNLSDGLIEATMNDSIKKVYDLKAGAYIPFPENMQFRSYKDDLLILSETENQLSSTHKECVIDRSGKIILEKLEGNIRIIDKHIFIINDMLIDIKRNITLKDADLIMPYADNQILVLKNRKLFILDTNFNILKEFCINETKKPWFNSINNPTIMMGFTKKTHSKKNEPRHEENTTIIINTETNNLTKLSGIPRLSDNSTFTIKDNSKSGLINNNGEVLLDIIYSEIKPLKDSENKLFFVRQEDKSFIFDSLSKTKTEVPYHDMEEFRDGLAIGYTTNYELIDESLNVIFSLEYMGHRKYFYQNGYLCYHVGNWRDSFDVYTVINANGAVIMPPKKCNIKKNAFNILEISDDENNENMLFDMNKGDYIELKINAPMKSTGIDYNNLKIDELGITSNSKNNLKQLTITSSLDNKKE